MPRYQAIEPKMMIGACGRSRLLFVAMRTLLLSSMILLPSRCFADCNSWNVQGAVTHVWYDNAGGPFNSLAACQQGLTQFQNEVASAGGRGNLVCACYGPSNGSGATSSDPSQQVGQALGNLLRPLQKQMQLQQELQQQRQQEQLQQSQQDALSSLGESQSSTRQLKQSSDNLRSQLHSLDEADDAADAPDSSKRGWAACMDYQQADQQAWQRDREDAAGVIASVPEAFVTEGTDKVVDQAGDAATEATDDALKKDFDMDRRNDENAERLNQESLDKKNPITGEQLDAAEHSAAECAANKLAGEDCALGKMQAKYRALKKYFQDLSNCVGKYPEGQCIIVAKKNLDAAVAAAERSILEGASAVIVKDALDVIPKYVKNTAARSVNVMQKSVDCMGGGH